MSVGDMPTISASAYGSPTFSLAEEPIAQMAVMPRRQSIGEGAFEDMVRNKLKDLEKKPMSIGRRFVQVIVSDPHPMVPLADCILYKGEPMATDLTDQELYFGLEVNKLLTDHNEKRVKIIDKSVKDRTEFLEPAKIRELRMTVVKIADL